MKTTIHYNSTNELEKRDAAIADIREYLGPQRFQTFFDALLEDAPEDRPRTALFLGMICGIEGYPITAMVDYVNAHENKPLNPPQN